MLARRFLLSRSSGGFVSFIAWVSVAGVALGVLALTVVTSVLNGFEGELKKAVTALNGDLVLYSKGDPIADSASVERKIRALLPEARAVSPALVTELMASGPGGVAGAVLEGFDPATISQATSIPSLIVSGRMPEAPGEAAVGSALAERLGLGLGESMRLVAPYAGGENGAPRVTRASIVGIVKIGNYEYDSQFVFEPISEVQKFLEIPGRASNFMIRLAPGADSRAASDTLADNFGYPFRSKDWGQLNKNIFYAVKLEKAVIAIILTVIVIVASFNVVSALLMMIHDKSKEIAILKAMGFGASQNFRLFCMIGLGMGAAGTAVGVSLGALLNFVLRHTHWIDLPADIYYIGFLPVVTRWREVGLIALVAMLISFLATLYPAMQVARRSPLDGLRYE